MEHMEEEDLLEDLAATLTCPSCHITIIPKRMRAMCPFCGSFYDPAVEGDPLLRSAQPRLPLHHVSHQESGSTDHMPLVTLSQDHLRLPRLVSHSNREEPGLQLYVLSL